MDTTGTQTGAQAAEAPKRLVVKIGGEDVDFTEVPPITGGDKKALFKDYGVNFNKVLDLNPDEEGRLILFFIRKVRPKTTEPEADAIPIQIQQGILGHFVKTSRSVESPFSSPSSTSSPASTAGVKAS